jgi:hypothetical protein
MAETIILGALSSFIAAIISFVIVVLFNKNVIPWYRNMVYKGVRIDGNWTRKITIQVQQKATLVLKQNAENITGIFNVLWDAKEKYICADYSIIGHLQNRLVAITAIPSKSQLISQYVILLEITEEQDNLRLVGKILFYDDQGKRGVREDTVEFNRCTA